MQPFRQPAQIRIGVIGLGYVGLPLAVAFGRFHDTTGFDVNADRIRALAAGQDATGEVGAEELAAATGLRFSSHEADLAGCNVFIVAVPTPIDAERRPDLGPLIAASRLVGRVISRGDVVIYESTVYPGATEEDCIPVIEEVSGLRYNTDFFAGYSPERVSPGDKARPMTKITKITSGSTPDVADFVDRLYRQIIEAGTFKAGSIRVAEAAKIVENTQRDVNIALMNELSVVLSRLGLDTREVLEAAGTKWNFIRLRPGLVGGHCIGVDPYYLLHRAMAAGYTPEMIRVARDVNEGMARHAADRLVAAMIARDMPVSGTKVLVYGFAFKENCPDIRNTKVADLVAGLNRHGIVTEVVDPLVDPALVREEYGLALSNHLPERGDYAAVVVAVGHDDVVGRGADALRGLMGPGGGLLFDLSAAFAPAMSDLRL